MKKTIIFTAILFTAVASVFVLGSCKSAATKKVIRVTTKFVDNEQTAKSLVKVVEGVNRRANGSLELQLFTAGTYPYGKDGMELIVNGADVIQVDGINFIADYVPDFDAVTGPFLYTSFDEYLAMTKSDLVKKLNQEALEKHGIRVLSLDWVFGFRSMMLKKPVKEPSDAMGANPIAMPYPDTYSAIQQGVIDGVEGSILTYWGTKQYENVKEYSLTRHLLGVSSVTISEKCWKSLTAEQQQILSEEFQKGMEDNLKETLALENEYAELLKQQGVNFYEVNAPAFAEVASVVYTKFPKWTPGIYDQIQAELKKIRADLKK